MARNPLRNIYSKNPIHDEWDKCWSDYEADPGDDWPYISARHSDKMMYLMNKQIKDVMNSIKYVDFGPKPSKTYSTITKGMTTSTISTNSVNPNIITNGGSGNLFVQNSKQRVIVSNAKTDTTSTLMRTNDLLERFMEFCSKEGATREEFLNLPIKTLIAYMILVAAEEEGMDSSEQDNVIKLELNKPQPRCIVTKRFIAQDAWDAGVRFISPAVMQDYMDRVAA